MLFRSRNTLGLCGGAKADEDGPHPGRRASPPPERRKADGDCGACISHGGHRAWLAGARQGRSRRAAAGLIPWRVVSRGEADHGTVALSRTSTRVIALHTAGAEWTAVDPSSSPTRPGSSSPRRPGSSSDMPRHAGEPGKGIARTGRPVRFGVEQFARPVASPRVGGEAGTPRAPNNFSTAEGSTRGLAAAVPRARDASSHGPPRRCDARR